MVLVLLVILAQGIKPGIRQNSTQYLHDMKGKLQRIRDNRLSLDEILSHTDDLHAIIHTARARLI